MTSRQKKGTGFAISGAAFIAAAIVFFATDITPDWLPTVMNIIGVIGAALGFTIVLPNISDEE